MYQRRKFLCGLLLLDLAAFVTAVMLLPRRPSFSWNSGNYLSYLVNSRMHWEIAWGGLLAAVMASVAAVLIVESFVQPRDGGNSHE